MREEEKQQLAAVFEVLPAVQAVLGSVELSSSEGTQGVFAESSERRLRLWELGTKALPTEQAESRSEGYSQLPGHLGQIKHMPWA